MLATKEKNKHIDQLHFEHKLWLSVTRYHADELEVYQKRLEEIAAKNNSEEIRKSIAHFQNQFIIQKEQLDILSHNIRKHEQSLAKYAQEHPVAIDHVLFKDHTALRDQTDTFSKLFKELKIEFANFISQWL